LAGLRVKQAQFLRDVSTDPEFLRGAYAVKSEIAVPLLKDDDVLGVLNVEAENSALLDEYDVNLLNALAGSIAVAIDNARLHAEVKLMAMTDVVSGLANRRAFDEVLEAEMIRASRYSHPISLIILDLDSFKEYNDRWGHPAGDVRLREIADLLRANVREPDLAARYGGEEFAVILPNTSKGGAIQLAERLCRSAEASAPYRNGVDSLSGYTISLGVATYPDDASSTDELLHAADSAELMAKRLGESSLCSKRHKENPTFIRHPPPCISSQPPQPEYWTVWPCSPTQRGSRMTRCSSRDMTSPLSPTATGHRYMFMIAPPWMPR
jgi:diguanylate cyclase (GGDEF)-like protein